MIMLRAVISVKEIPPNCAKLRSKLPGIRSLISERPNRDEAKLLQYLQQGVVGCFYPDPGLAYDVLEPSRQVDRQLPEETLQVAHSVSPSFSTSIEPGCVLTDGVWLWPAVLSYYVARYHVKLDPEFVAHASANNWIIRQPEVKLDNLCWDAFQLPPEA